MKINLEKIENRPILQCCNCKENSMILRMVEVKKGYIYFNFICVDCDCPIYLHSPFEEEIKNKIIVIDKNQETKLKDNHPPEEIKFELLEQK